MGEMWVPNSKIYLMGLNLANPVITHKARELGSRLKRSEVSPSDHALPCEV